MTDGPQNILTRRIALAFETTGVLATAPTIYIIADGKLTPTSTKKSTPNRVTGNRDPVLSTREPETFKISIPMPALLESNGLGELLLATFGTDTCSAQLGSSGAYDHVFTANDTVKSFTLWLYDTLDPQSIRMCVVDSMKMEIDKSKGIHFTFDCIGADMVSSATFGSATYVNVATDKPKMIPATQSILEFGPPQSNIASYWESITITSKEAPKYGAIGKAPVPTGSATPRAVVKGDRDASISIDFIDVDGIERKRWRQGGDTIPTATAQQEVQSLTKFRVRSFGNEVGTTAIWGYAHQANVGAVTATWQGTYSGTGAAEFECKCTTAGAPDKIMWRKNGGAWSAEVTVSAGAITLSDGVTVTYSATTGQTLNDTQYGFTFYQRMIEFCCPSCVIDDVNQKDSSDFYRSTISMYHESGPGGTKPSMTSRCAKTPAYT